MVGSPKHLKDLARLEADVQFTCRACGRAWVRNREELTREIIRTGGSLVWSEVPRSVRCPNCGGDDNRAVPLPFTGRQREKPALSRLERAILDIALTILRDAAERSRWEKVGSLEVRLALLVVHRHAADRDVTAAFWRAAVAPTRSAGGNCLVPLAWIEQRLRSRGLLAGDDQSRS